MKKFLLLTTIVFMATVAFSAKEDHEIPSRGDSGKVILSPKDGSGNLVPVVEVDGVNNKATVKTGNTLHADNITDVAGTGAPVFDDGIKTDSISEKTGDNGVSIDGVLLKDDDVQADSITDAAGTGKPNFPNGMDGFDPTKMTDIEATKLGYFKYRMGTAYGGGTPTFSCHDSGVEKNGVSWIIPYQTSDGTWFARFNIACTWGADIALGGAITMNGITINSTSSDLATCAGAIYRSGGTAGGRVSWAYVRGGQPTLYTATNHDREAIYCDAELTAKPTWAH